MKSFEEIGNGLMLAHEGQQQILEYLLRRLTAFFARRAPAAEGTQQA